MIIIKTVTLGEAAGGLFDFNATLPLEALQFILLTVLLTIIFYKPVGQLLENRERVISDNLAEASKKLLRADELCQQYDAQIKEAKIEAQASIAKAESEARELVAQEISRAQIDAASIIADANREFGAQKKIIFQDLESEVDELSQLIKEKVLGKNILKNL